MGQLHNLVQHAKDLISGKAEQHHCRLPLATAYVCVECRNCQNNAPKGKCNICGSGFILAIAALISHERAQVRHRLQGLRDHPLPERPPALPAVAMQANAGLYLTAPEEPGPEAA